MAKKKTKTKTPPCSEVIVIRVRPQEKKEIQAEAKQAGRSVSDLGRRALLGLRLTSALTEKEVAAIAQLMDVRGDLVNVQNALNGTSNAMKLRLFNNYDFMHKWLNAIEQQYKKHIEEMTAKHDKQMTDIRQLLHAREESAVREASKRSHEIYQTLQNGDGLFVSGFWYWVYNTFFVLGLGLFVYILFAMLSSVA